MRSRKGCGGGDFRRCKDEGVRSAECGLQYDKTFRPRTRPRSIGRQAQAFVGYRVTVTNLNRQYYELVAALNFYFLEPPKEHLTFESRRDLAVIYQKSWQTCHSALTFVSTNEQFSSILCYATRIDFESQLMENLRRAKKCRRPKIATGNSSLFSDSLVLRPDANQAYRHAVAGRSESSKQTRPEQEFEILGGTIRS